MAERVPFAVLSSGRGTNLRAIVDHLERGSLTTGELVGVGSDVADAEALRYAREKNIPAFAVPRAGPREAHDARMLEALARVKPHFLVLAGYMRIVGEGFLAPFRSTRGYFRVVNVHPALLPAFPGLGGYAQAFHHGAKVAGATIHLVDEKLDSGPILAQAAFSIDDCASPEAVERLGLEVEHELYSKTLEWVLPERFELAPPQIPGGRPRVRPH